MADVVTVQPRMIDRNGHRWGATISAVVLLIGFVFDARLVAPIFAAILGISSFFGLRYSLLGLIYRSAKAAFNLDIPVDPEEETPPRFAQLLGFVFLGLATLGFYAFDSGATGWTLTLLVAGLQTLLGVTGICVGCEMYLYGKKLAAARHA